MPIPETEEYKARTRLAGEVRGAESRERVAEIGSGATQTVGLANAAQRAEQAKLAYRASQEALRHKTMADAATTELGEGFGGDKALAMASKRQEAIMSGAREPREGMIEYPIHVIRGGRFGQSYAGGMAGEEWLSPQRAAQAANRALGIGGFEPTGAALERVKGAADPRSILYKTEKAMYDTATNKATYDEQVKSLGDPRNDPILKALSGHFYGTAIGNAQKNVPGDPTTAYNQLSDAYSLIRWGSNFDELKPALARYAEITGKNRDEEAAKLLGTLKSGKYDAKDLLSLANFLKDIRNPQARARPGGVAEPTATGAVGGKGLPTLEQYKAASPAERTKMDRLIAQSQAKEEALDKPQFTGVLDFSSPRLGLFETPREAKEKWARIIPKMEAVTRRQSEEHLANIAPPQKKKKKE